MPLFKIEFKAVLFLACGWSGMRQGMPGDDPEDRKKFHSISFSALPRPPFLALASKHRYQPVHQTLC